MRKVVYISLLTLSLAAFTQTAGAEPTGLHMYEAAKANPVLSAEFQRIMTPLFSDAPWVKTFGTTSPSTVETLDGQTYDVYWGCKPHDCITESYVVMYNQKTRQITAGAFVHNDYDGPNVTNSHITWLGKTDFDAAQMLGGYLY